MIKNSESILQKIDRIQKELDEIKSWIKNYIHEPGTINIQTITDSTSSIEQSIELTGSNENTIVATSDLHIETQNLNIPIPIKKAFIVGINLYDPSLNCNLRGCVNDALAIKNLITELYGFSKENIEVATDYNARKQNILDGLEWLISGSVPGDELLFSFSGHGSQVPDYNGDEIDKFDEIICPTDLNWDDPITDDILASYFKRVPKGANLTFICDSCNSGTVQRAMANKNFYGRVVRSIEHVTLNSLYKGQRIKSSRKIGVKTFVSQPDQNHILFAGCSENDYSNEGTFNGKFHGALTFNLCETLKENPKRTWREIEQAVTRRIKQVWGYNQTPQLVTKKENIKKIIFS